MGAAIRTWETLMARKAMFRITLVVRGEVITKEYASEKTAKRWRDAYLEQSLQPDKSGVTDVQFRKFYR